LLLQGELNCRRIQEAQLPLRNSASAMHFFVAKLPSIAVMTYSYVYHIRKLLSGKIVTQTANKLQHATATRTHDARPHCRLKSSPWTRLPMLWLRGAKTLNKLCQKLESLTYMTATIVLVSLYFTFTQ